MRAADRIEKQVKPLLEGLRLAGVCESTIRVEGGIVRA